MVVVEDELGGRMKRLENQSRTVLAGRSYLVVRCDGRSFSRYTAGLDRPFDTRLAADMAAVAVALAQEVSGSLVAYTQSDEISVISSDLAQPRSQHWFGGVVQKIASCAASYATATFAERRRDLGGGLATFDARAFTLASAEEVAEYLWWRQADARRNAVSMLCHAHLGRAAVEGVGTTGRIAMLAGAGVFLEEVEAGFVNGRLISPALERGEVTYTHRRSGELVTVGDVVRRVWRTGPAPLLRDATVVARLLSPPVPA